VNVSEPWLSFLNLCHLFESITLYCISIVMNGKLAWLYIWYKWR